METRANYAAIGLFTLIVIGLAFGFIYWIKRYDEAGQRVDLYLEFQGTVNGLARGGAVYFNGIKVGEVTGLSFDPQDPNRVSVVANVARSTPIKSDTRAEVNFNFLTGVAYVELFGGSPQASDLLAGPDPAMLRGTPSSLTDIITGANRMFRSAEVSLGRINDMVEQITPSLEASVKNVETFTDALARNSQGVDEFLKNVSEMSESVGVVSSKLEGLVNRADSALAAVDPDKIRQTVDSTQSFMKRLDDASNQIDPIISDVRKVTADMSRFSGKLDSSLDGLNQLVAAIDTQKIATSLDGISAFADKLGKSSGDFDSIIADAKSTAERVNRFTERIESRSDDIDSIISDARQLTERVNTASARLDGILGKADQFLGTEGGENFFTEAAAAARSIRQVADTFNARADEITAGLSKFSGRGLDNVQALVNELRSSVGRIDRAVSTIERDPSSIVFGSNSGIRDYNRR